jgi:Zn-dependent protease with chaperone function
MPFLLLLVMMVACLPGEWPAPPAWLGSLGSALLTWAGCGLLVGGAALLAWWVRGRLVRHPEQRSASLRRYRAWRLYHLLGLLAVYLTSLYVLGWVHTIRSGALTGLRSFPGLELLILAPFLAALIFSWAMFYSVERAAHEATDRGAHEALPGRWAYVRLQTQTNLILICPPLLLMIVQEILVLLFAGLAKDWVFPILSVALIIGILVGLPWILRLMLGLRSLPLGPVRDRLLATGRRLNFRCNDILLWNTRQGMANAMVTGLVPWLRYVVVTDRLLADLTPEEVEAVFGHEVGHVKHKHLLYYCGFLLLSLLALTGIWVVLAAVFHIGGEPAATSAATQEAAAALPFLAMMGAYVFLVFGFLSRRCERQADIFGCRAVSCAAPACQGHATDAVLAPRGEGLCPTGIRTFVEALEKVARLNGMNREKPGWLSSWLHSTIARRVDFLQQMSTDPAVESRFQRAVGRVKWGLFVGLGVVLAVAGLLLAWVGIRLEELLAYL